MKGTVKEPGILLDFLLELMQTPKKKTCRQMLKFKGVTVDGVVIQRANHELKPGQVVEVKRVNQTPSILPGTSKGGLRIHYEDQAIIVVEKPVGLLSIANDSEKNLTMHAVLNNYLHAQNGGRVYVVHRLDRNVGGLMVFAKTLKAQSEIQLNWTAATKKYVAQVDGIPKEPEGRIESWLQEITTYKVIVTGPSAQAKHSITEYSTRKTLNGRALLDVNLLTGRRHQIRVHLASMGCPIVGDRVYGTGTPNSREIRLFAYFLSFPHPNTGEMATFKVPIPNWDTVPSKKK